MYKKCTESCAQYIQCLCFVYLPVNDLHGAMVCFIVVTTNKKTNNKMWKRGTISVTKYNTITEEWMQNLQRSGRTYILKTEQIVLDFLSNPITFVRPIVTTTRNMVCIYVISCLKHRVFCGYFSQNNKQKGQQGGVVKKISV